MPPEVAVLIPTRDRPELFLKAARSVLDTSDALVVGYVDSDQERYFSVIDEPFAQAHERHPGSFVYDTQRANDPHQILIIQGRRLGPVHSINAMATALASNNSTLVQHHYPNIRAFVYMTDDSTVSPHGWDRWLLKTLDQMPKRLGIVSCHYADDCTRNVNFAAMSKEMIGAMGWFGPPEMYGWYWDTALEIVGDTIGMVYAKRDELRMTHDVAPNVVGPVASYQDCLAFHQWCLTKRREAIGRVREAFAAL